jgi:MFS family permease
MKTVPGPRFPFLRLGLLTAAALAIHGYHLGVEDGEIFLPAARKLLNPALYSYAAEFFVGHQHLSLFGPILAGTARLAHLSMDWTIFLWYIATLYGALAACWMLAAVSFNSPRARWSAVLLVAAVLTMPATNTGLLLMDPYLTARSFSTPLTLLALAGFLRRRYLLAALATLATAAIHPQMAVYLLFLMAVMALAARSAARGRHRPAVAAAAAAILPAGFSFTPATGPYREALYARDFFFLSNWTWYDWIGMLAPLVFLAWFWKGKLRSTTPQFERLSFALIPFGLLSILVAAIFSSSHNLDTFARLQPLRCFHLITLVFILYLGGVLGEYAARKRPWVLPAILLPLAAGMFLVARETYPFSPQVEFPWPETSSNPWVDTLLWVRNHTPVNAVFAVDSRYFKDPGVDVHGFRAISERSALADYFKDSGVVAMFPALAGEWKQMSDATYGLNHFQAADFTRLATRYPVTWAVIHGPAPLGMACPYQQRGFAVCRIPGVPDHPQPPASTSVH